jgi:hypothetical protein
MAKARMFLKFILQRGEGREKSESEDAGRSQRGRRAQFDALSRYSSTRCSPCLISDWVVLGGSRVRCDDNVYVCEWSESREVYVEGKKMRRL